MRAAPGQSGAMRGLTPILPILLLMLVQACADAPGMSPVPAEGEDTCGARAQVALVGQGATALERVLILGQVRLLRPGDAATMDHRPERINFLIDGNERIARITCG